MKVKNDKSQAQNKPTLVVYLLDRSGSMANGMDETISGFNGYVRKMKDEGIPGMRLSLTQFDSIGIDLLHDGVPLCEVMTLNRDTFVPRGNTPLYDAIAKTISAAEIKAGDKFKVLFAIHTDGVENCSSQWTLESIRELIKKKEDKDHWTFAYIGVGVEGFAAVRGLAQGTQSVNNVLHTTPETSKQAFAAFAGGNMMYARSAGTAMNVAPDFYSGQKTTAPADEDVT